MMMWFHLMRIREFYDCYSVKLMFICPFYSFSFSHRGVLHSENKEMEKLNSNVDLAPLF